MTEVTIELGRARDVVIARLEGELDFSNIGEAMRQISEAATNDVVGVAVDLSVIRYIDSAGVRMLFELATKLEACRQRIGLVLGEDSPVRRLVQITSLDSVAPLCSSVDECIEAIRSDIEDRI